MKSFGHKYLWIAMLSVCGVCSYAQVTSPVAAHFPNIAVMAFTGDKTVTPEQLNFITGKFSTELISSQKFTVLDRGKMDDILKEQGFQQTGSCDNSHCKVQMGQLLGVEYLVAGGLVNFGSEYAMHLEYIDVASGQIKMAVDLEEKGDLQDAYKGLCHQGAQRLLQAISPAVVASPSKTVPADAIPQGSDKPMSTKRKVAIALWGTSLVGVGSGVYFNQKALDYDKDFDAATTAKNAAELRSANSNLSTAKTGRAASYGLSIGTALLGLVLWFLPEGSAK